MAFLDTLPDPDYKIGIAGQVDAAGRTGPGFASVKFSSEEPMMSTRANSGRHEKATAYFHKWTLDIDYNPLTCEEFHPIYSFLLLKKNTMEPFYVSLPQYRDQLTTEKLSAAGLLHPIGYDVIEVEDAASAPIVTRPGQLFTIGSSPKVYMATRVETASDYVYALTGANTERIWFTPKSIVAIPPATSLFFDNIRLRVVQLDDIQEYELNASGLFKYSIKLEEVVDG